MDRRAAATELAELLAFDPYGAVYDTKALYGSSSSAAAGGEAALDDSAFQQSGGGARRNSLPCVRSVFAAMIYLTTSQRRDVLGSETWSAADALPGSLPTSLPAPSSFASPEPHLG